MKILVESVEEKKCVEMLMQNLQYAWDSNGEDCDAFYKAFQYINDNPQNWRDGELIMDYRPFLKNLLSNIKQTHIEMK